MKLEGIGGIAVGHLGSKICGKIDYLNGVEGAPEKMQCISCQRLCLTIVSL